MNAPIASLSNPTVKDLVKLRQRGERAKRGMLLIDGARALRIALCNGFPVGGLFLTDRS